jgi:RNA polymerase sigma factor (sigma-70 family)
MARSLIAPEMRSFYRSPGCLEMTLLMHDPDLLRGFREGRPEALERVYRRYVRGIDRYLRALARTAGHPDLAQPSAVADLLQEVFFRAFSVTARRGYDSTREFGPYLAAMARNAFVDAVRACGREVLKAPDEIAFAMDEAASEHESGYDPDVLAVLNSYLTALPAPLIHVYEQRFVQGRSQEAASTALGVSRRAIRTAEGRLRRGLRKALVYAGISLRELSSTQPSLSTTIGASVRAPARGS